MDDGNPRGKQKDLIDITAIIAGCSQALNVSDPFLCDENSFSLHDAMAASQLTDRKMDCCEIPMTSIAPFGTKVNEDNTGYPRPAPTGLDGPFTPLLWEKLTEKDALFISLGCLVRLEAMLGGASVGESTFTCLYAHFSVMCDMKTKVMPEPEGIAEKLKNVMSDRKALGPTLDGTVPQVVVFSSSLMLVELTSKIREAIINADIYEEEDFIHNTNDIPFFNETPSHVNPLPVLDSALQRVRQMESGIIRDALQLVLSFQRDLLTVTNSMVRTSSHFFESLKTRQMLTL